MPQARKRRTAALRTPTPRRVNPLTEHIVYDVGDVAEILKCGESKVWELIRDDKLRSFKVGRLVRVSRADLDGFMARGGAPNGTAP